MKDIKNFNSVDRWDRKWADMEAEHRYTHEHLDLARELQPYLINEIADLGCGNGMMTNNKDGHVWGIDQSTEAIRKAIEKNPDACFVIGQAHNTPWESNMFDTVLLSEIIEHYPYFTDLLDEAIRLSRGHIVAVVPYNSCGSEHYHPHWSIPYAAEVLSYCGEIVELRRIKHERGFWLLAYVETRTWRRG